MGRNNGSAHRVPVVIETSSDLVSQERALQAQLETLEGLSGEESDRKRHELYAALVRLRRRMKCSCPAFAGR